MCVWRQLIGERLCAHLCGGGEYGGTVCLGISVVGGECREDIMFVHLCGGGECRKDIVWLCICVVEVNLGRMLSVCASVWWR